MVESEVDARLRAGSGTDGSTAAEAEFIDLQQVWRRLREEKRTILIASLAAGVLATVVAFLLPLSYTSTVEFIPPALGSNSSLSSVASGQLAGLGAADMLGGIRNSGDLYAGILKSRSIADALIRRFDLMSVYGEKKESLAEKDLQASTEIATDSRSTIVTLKVTAKSPELARDLGNAYMDALRETNGRLALTQASQRRVFFEQQLEREKNALADAEVELKKTEEQSGLIAPTGQAEAEIQTIAETQAQIALRETELAALRDSATEQNPQVIQLKSEIDDLRGQLGRLQRGGGGATAAIPTAKVPEVQLEYVRRERDVKYHEALFDVLSRQYEAARLDESKDAPMLQVLDSASYPDTKSSPKRVYYLLGGLGFGCVAGCGWVLLRRRPLGAAD